MLSRLLKRLRLIAVNAAVSFVDVLGVAVALAGVVVHAVAVVIALAIVVHVVVASWSC